jgi:hypothetical protein
MNKISLVLQLLRLVLNLDRIRTAMSYSCPLPARANILVKLGSSDQGIEVGEDRIPDLNLLLLRETYVSLLTPVIRELPICHGPIIFLHRVDALAVPRLGHWLP